MRMSPVSDRYPSRVLAVAAKAGHARADNAALGALPEWDLTDLYPGMDAPDLKRDIERAIADATVFGAEWKGKLAAEAENPGKGGLGKALRAYEALEELIGRIASYAGLIYAGNTSDPQRAKLYGDIQEKMTDASSHLLFFTLELNVLDDAVVLAALDADPASATTARGCSTCARTSHISWKIASSNCSTRSRSPAAAPGTASSTKR